MKAQVLLTLDLFDAMPGKVIAELLRAASHSCLRDCGLGEVPTATFHSAADAEKAAISSNLPRKTEPATFDEDAEQFVALIEVRQCNCGIECGYYYATSDAFSGFQSSETDRELAAYTLAAANVREGWRLVTVEPICGTAEKWRATYQRL